MTAKLMLINDGSDATVWYIGKTHLDAAEIRVAIKDGKAIELDDTFIYSSKLTMTREGPAQISLLLPIGQSASGLNMWVKPVAFLDPAQDGVLSDDINQRLEQLREANREKSAQHSGIVLPGSNLRGK